MLKSGLYNVTGAGIRLVLSVLTIPLLIRILGVEEYGLWVLASTVVGVVTLAEAGLSIATTVFVSQDLKSSDATRLAQTLTVTLSSMAVLSTLAAIALIAFAPLLMNLFPAVKPEQRSMTQVAFQLGSIVVWTRLMQQVLVGLEQAFDRYGSMNALNTLQVMLSTLGLVAVAWLGGRAAQMMLWMAIVGLLTLVLHTVFAAYLLRGWRMKFDWSRARFKEVAGYSVLTWLTNLGGVMFGQFDRIIVGSILGPSILGVYAAITSIVVQINVFSSLPVQPILPLMSAAHAKNNVNSLYMQATVKKAFTVNVLVVVAACFSLLVLAPLVISLMLPDANNSQTLFAFSCAVIIYSLYSLNAVGYYILFAIKAVRVNFAINILSGGSALLLIGILASHFGLSGAILGNAAYCLSLLMVPIALQRLRRHSVQHGQIQHGVS